MTTEEFIEKAKLVHGDTYNYDKTVFKTYPGKVIITCLKHGDFEQRAGNHLSNNGCPTCGKERRGEKKRKGLTHFLEKSKEVHGDLYDYSKVDYTVVTSKVDIICKKHGVFQQTPHKHMSGRGCPACGSERRTLSTRLSTKQFIERSMNVHGNFYDYSNVSYSGWEENVDIVCPKHGLFKQQAGVHISGCGCPECGRLKTANSRKMTAEEFVEKSKKVHKDKYDYSQSCYIDYTSKVKIICSKHGPFFKPVCYHLLGQGCPRCSIEQAALEQRSTREEFIERAIKKHGELYDYSKVVYSLSQNKVEIICPKHGSFWQTAHSHLLGRGCKKCKVIISEKEQLIFDYLSDFIYCKQTDRQQIKPQELDIYIPELNIGVEFCGLYFHSDKFRRNRYHIDKLNVCEEKGVRLIQIFEDEWLEKEEICKSRLLNIIGKTPNKIFARKCEIREVSAKEAREFLNTNHIQGNVNSKVKLGLYYNNELVSLMTFGNLRKNLGQTHKEGHYELLRFCNKLYTNVVGGASKLLKYFEKKYQPESIISYADRRWSNGDLYKSLGFDFVSYSEPNYFYIKNAKRENRFKYRKSELVKQGFDVDKTEKQIMEERGYKRIYDCGTMKFVKKY